MKNLMTVLVVMMLSVVTMFGQASTTFVKSITCDNNNSPVFALAGNVNVSEWDETYIRITCTIEVTNSTETILTRLLTLGRYNIEVKNENGVMSISAPKMANHVAIQGTDLLENVRYEITVPRGMEFQRTATVYSNVLQAI